MKLKFKIIIFAVAMAIIGVMIYSFPIQSFIILFCGLIFVVGWTLTFGFKHPKWYVKVYTALYLIWGYFCMFIWFGMYEWFGNPYFYPIALAPLIPLWYLMYKYEFYFPEKWHKRKRAHKVS